MDVELAQVDLVLRKPIHHSTPSQQHVPRILYQRARVYLTQKPSAPIKKPSPTQSTHVGGISTNCLGCDSKPYPVPNASVSKARFSFDMVVVESGEGDWGLGGNARPHEGNTRVARVTEKPRTLSDKRNKKEKANVAFKRVACGQTSVVLRVQ